MDRFGLDVLLAAVVAVWFVVAGAAKLRPGPQAGRRAVQTDPGWLQVARRVRGVLEIVGGLAVLAGAATGALGLRIQFPGFAVGLALSVLAAWTAVETLRRPLRPLLLALALVGFALTVFYTGFRE